MHYYHQSETVLKSVEVEVVPNYPALRMMWQSKVDVKDVKSSFYKITSTLQETEYPLFVIVDLSNNPRLPIADTMIEALRGPFRNKKLIAWLVLSPNRDARWIADLLSKASGRNNIQWFETESEIFAYLDNYE